VAVASVEVGRDDIPMLTLTTAADQARCCPGREVRSERAHSWVRTRPRDLPVAGRRTALTGTKRRWRCQNQACPCATFNRGAAVDPVAAPADGQVARRLGAAFADGGRTVVQAAQDFEVSWPVANAAFAAHAEAVLPAATPPTEHLGIDEIRRGKARFRLITGPDGGEAWEVVADRWHVGFADLTGGAGLPGTGRGPQRRRGVGVDRPAEPHLARRRPRRGDRHVHRVRATRGRVCGVSSRIGGRQCRMRSSWSVFETSPRLDVRP
jgi:hypothetical protein